MMQNKELFANYRYLAKQLKADEMRAFQACNKADSLDEFLRLIRVQQALRSTATVLEEIEEATFDGEPSQELQDMYKRMTGNKL